MSNTSKEKQTKSLTILSNGEKMSQQAALVNHFKNLRSKHNLTLDETIDALAGVFDALEWDVLDIDTPEDYQEQLKAEYDAIRQMLTSF